MAAPPSIGSTSKVAEVVEEQPHEPKAKKTKKSKKGKERQVEELGDEQMEDGDDSANSNFKLVQNTMRLPLAPIFAEDPLEGVRQCLESWILRYVPRIDAVLLSVSWPPQFIEENAPLAPSAAFTLARVRWEGIGFRPQVGKLTTGKLSLATPSMLSLLLHNLFNASIPADQIPQDTYEWDADAILPYSLAPPPLTSAPDLSQRQAAIPEETESSQAGDSSLARTEEPAEPEAEAERGCWVHKTTRKPLGGEDGKISFTVVGLTVANSMISIHGSLLPKAAEAYAAKQAAAISEEVTANGKRKRT